MTKILYFPGFNPEDNNVEQKDEEQGVEQIALVANGEPELDSLDSKPRMDDRTEREVSRFLAEFDLQAVQFSGNLHSLLDRLDSVIARYSSNPACVRQAINSYYLLAGDDEIAMDMFSRRACLRKSQELARRLLRESEDLFNIRYASWYMAKTHEKLG